jgi:hypothetical protein
MTTTVPVPQMIEGCPALAAIAVPARPGELPVQFVVICEQQCSAVGDDHRYVAWRVGRRDGGHWTARHSEPGLTWPQAIESLARRASLPAPGQ